MDTIRDFLFGRPPSTEELVERWRREINNEVRSIERQIRGIERQENKTIAAIKTAVKRNDTASAKILAKEIISSRKAKDRFHTAIAQLKSVSMKLQQNFRMYKLCGTIKSSTEILAMMNQAVRVPEIHQTISQMAKEMEKSGIIQEMIDDIIDDAFDDEVDDEDQEIQNVLHEIAFNKAKELPAKSTYVTQKPLQTQEDEDDKETKAIEEEFSALKFS